MIQSIRPISWSFALLASVAASAVGAVTDVDRTQVYQEFRVIFDARKYQEALPVAERLFALTKEQYGTDDRALVNPLSNLATTAYRMRDYPTAETHYIRGVEILEKSAAGADRMILRPLQGLGSTYIALRQYENAVFPLKQAVDLSRNLDGLFNIDQLKYLEPLIAAYMALDRRTLAEKEHEYALRVAENAYGREHQGMLKPLDSYAHWLESTGRYTTSRALYARALIIAEKREGNLSLNTVTPLAGIARTYRLEYLNGPEEPSEHEEDLSIGVRPELTGSGPHLNPDGERALRQALVVITKNKPLDHKRFGETLVELGDWFLSGGGLPKSMDFYREGWKELAQVQGTALLESPQLLAYKGPSSSVKRSNLDPEDADLRYVELAFTVSKEGRTSNFVVASADAPEALQRAVESSVKKSRYRPRFENGEPVETKAVTLREQLLVRKPKNQDQK